MTKRHLRNDEGATAVVFAFALVPLLMGGGVAIDYMRMANFQSDLQGAVDSAALAGAAYHRGSDTQRRTAATNAFNANKPTGETVVLANPTIVGNTVRVTATSNVKATFMKIGWGNGVDAAVVAATAVARWPLAPVCIHTLSNVAAASLRFNSNSTLQAPNCAVQVNSTVATAITVNSNSDLVTAETCKVGGAVINSTSTILTSGTTLGDNDDARVPTCPTKPDPLAGLVPPPVSTAACTATNLTIDANTTLAPGRYCGRTEIQNGPGAGDTIVTLVPGGEYSFGGDACIPDPSFASLCLEDDPSVPGVDTLLRPTIQGGELILNFNAQLIGTDVLIYITGNNTSRLNVKSNTRIDISGRRTGTYKGMVLFQRNVGGLDNAGLPRTNFNIINSNGSSTIEGVIYTPETAIQYNSNSGAVSSPWMMIFAQSLDVNSGGVRGANPLNVGADYAGSLVPRPDILVTDAGGPNLALIE